MKSLLRGYSSFTMIKNCVLLSIRYCSGGMSGSILLGTINQLLFSFVKDKFSVVAISFKGVIHNALTIAFAVESVLEL